MDSDLVIKIRELELDLEISRENELDARKIIWQQQGEIQNYLKRIVDLEKWIQSLTKVWDNEKDEIYNDF